jgi:cell division protein FtsB
MPERARDIVELVIAAGGGAGITGLFSWLNGRKPGEASILAATAQLQEALNKAAEHQMSGLRGEVATLKAEMATLRGELANERQRSNSLESILRRNGYDLSAAKEPGAYTVIDPATQTATITPAPKNGERP